MQQCRGRRRWNAVASDVKALGLRAQQRSLREVLTHESHWVRVYSACSLWQIERNVDEVLPVLLQELQCRPAGMEVLRCLADMGPLAKPAVAQLREIIDSETRLPVSGAIDSWVDADEEFRSAAATALERIEEGNYGVCITCKKSIPANRLKAIPHAKTCLKCQELLESKNR